MYKGHFEAFVRLEGLTFHWFSTRSLTKLRYGGPKKGLVTDGERLSELKGFHHAKASLIHVPLNVPLMETLLFFTI